MVYLVHFIPIFVNSGEQAQTALVNFPSAHERSYYCSTQLHAYGESTAVQKIFHMRASAKTKKTKNPKDGEIMSAFRTKLFT